MMEWQLSHFDYVASIKTWEAVIDRAMTDEQDRLASRIRKQLKGRTQAQIDRLILIIDALIGDYISIGNQIERIHAELEGSLHPAYTEWNEIYSTAIADWLLFAELCDIEPNEADLVPTWPEIFAIAALNELGGGIKHIQAKEKRNLPNIWHQRWLELDTAISCFSAVYDLVSISERMTEKADAFSLNLEQQISIKISLKNTEAIKKRHMPGNDLKDSFTAHYLLEQKNGNNITGSEAARRFYLQLPEDKKALIVRNPRRENAVDLAVRTLTAAITKKKRQ